MPTTPLGNQVPSSFLHSSSSNMHSTPKQATPSQKLNQMPPSSSSGGYHHRTSRGGSQHHTKSASSTHHAQVSSQQTATVASSASSAVKGPNVKRETHKDYLYGLNDAIIVEEVPIIVSVAPNGVYCTTVATTIQAPSPSVDALYPASTPNTNAVTTTSAVVTSQPPPQSTNSQSELGKILN